MRGSTGQRQWISWVVAGLALVGCKEENPAFDGADGGPGTTTATTLDDGGPDSGPVTTTSPPGSTSAVATSDGSTGETATTSGVVSTTSGETTTTGGGMETTAGESSTGACEMCGGAECIDLMTDDDNCGTCDNKCNPGNEDCVMGECV